MPCSGCKQKKRLYCFREIYPGWNPPAIHAEAYSLGIRKQSYIQKAWKQGAGQ